MKEVYYIPSEDNPEYIMVTVLIEPSQEKHSFDINLEDRLMTINAQDEEWAQKAKSYAVTAWSNCMRMD